MGEGGVGTLYCVWLHVMRRAVHEAAEAWSFPGSTCPCRESTVSRAPRAERLPCVRAGEHCELHLCHKHRQETTVCLCNTAIPVRVNNS